MALPLATPSRNRLLSFTRPQDRKWLLRTLLATVTLFASSFDLNHVPSAHFIIDFAAQAFANHSKIFTFAMIMNTNNANLELMMTRNDFEMFRKIWLNPVLLQLPAPAKSALAFYTGLLTLKSFEHTALMMEHFHFTNFIQQDVDPDLVEHIEKGQVKALYTFSAGCDIHSKSLVIPRGMIGQIISFDENTQIMWPLQFSIWDFALDVLEGHLNTANSIDLLDACIVFLTSLFESFGLFSHNWRTHWIDMNQVRCLGDLVSRLFDKFASLPNPPPLIIEHSIKFLQSFITVFPMDIGLCLKQANLISSVCERSFHSPVSHLYHLQQTIEIKKGSCNSFIHVRFYNNRFYQISRNLFLTNKLFCFKFNLQSNESFGYY